MTLKVLLAAVAVVSIAVGFALPTRHGRAEPKSQIQQIELGRG